MNWWDKILIGLVLWIMRGWFRHSTVGYDKNENVVFMEFYTDEFDSLDRKTIFKHITFQEYNAK